MPGLDPRTLPPEERQRLRAAATRNLVECCDECRALLRDQLLREEQRASAVRARANRWRGKLTHVTGIQERVGCSWHSEDLATSRARDADRDAAAWHDAHRDDLSRCDSWLCVCGRTDARGGTWETCDVFGVAVEPTPDWLGHVTCVECERVYDRQGVAVNHRGRTEPRA